MKITTLQPDSLTTELLLLLLSDDQYFISGWLKWKRKAGEYQTQNEAVLRLFPYLYQRVKRLRPRDSWSAMLKNTEKAHWLKNQLLLFEVSQIAPLLAQAKTPFLLLKGAAYWSLYYQNKVGARWTADVDLWVPVTSFFRVTKLLQKQGWEIADGTNIQTFKPHFFHAISFKKGNGKIDLHCHLLHFYLQKNDWKLLYKTANVQSVKLGSHTVLTLSDTLHLIHICVNGCRYTGTVHWQWILDAALVLKSKTIDWERLLILAQKLQLAWPLHQTLRVLKDDFKQPVPDFVVTQLQEMSSEFSYRRMYQLSVENTYRNLTASIEIYWWIYFNHVKNFSLSQKWGKEAMFYLQHVCQTSEPVLLVARFAKLLSKLVMRTVI